MDTPIILLFYIYYYLTVDGSMEELKKYTFICGSIDQTKVVYPSDSSSFNLEGHIHTYGRDAACRHATSPRSNLTAAESVSYFTTA